MTAKCEVNKNGAGWVYVVEQDPKKQKFEGNKVAALPTTLESGEVFTLYTDGEVDSIVQITPDAEGKGCLVNSVKLEVGESVVIGNLKITGE